ncbi:MAG: peptidoglycan editing factor PgeF, partial [Alphaproteobacteria bacterium]|nr:peptidoglycan editing factor PgeF [Alphaproteobacteria bacterium]
PWQFNGGVAPQVDGFVTNKPGIALGILTADCVPVLFADTQAQVIGAAHAGWRGAQAGILENTVKAMCSLGAERARIIAAIGPCIAQESYEVDAKFYQSFIDQYPVSQAFFMATPRKAYYLFDLPGFVKSCLKQAGIKTIESVNLNTYTNPDLFFSCRRAFHKKEPTFGNNISIIAM